MTVRRRSLAAVLAGLVLAPLASAQSVATKERAKLRQGPSATTESLGDVDAGTSLQVLGENGGWRQVRTPDGRTGFVWAEHLATAGEVAKPPAPAAPARTVADDIRDLREDVSALRQRPEAATAADVERLRQEIERLSASEREIARRLDEHAPPIPPAADPPPEASGTFASVTFGLGGVVGFAASRILQRRRDRRQRNRIRL